MSCLSLLLLSSAFGQNVWPDLSEPAAELQLGSNDAAIVVGIEDYIFLDDVPGANANASAWYAWLVKSRGVPLSSVRILRDSDAVRETILEEVEWASDQVGDDGTLWFVYIGHGAPDRDGQDGLIVGADAQQNPRSLYNRGLPQQDLLAAMDAHDPSVLIVDACFSGQSAGGSLVDGLQPMIPTYAVSSGPSTTMLTAGKSDQFAGPLPDGDRPAFSYLLLGALRGWGDADGDGVVSAAEAVEYSQGALTALLTDRRQTPQLHGPGDLPLGGGDESGPDLIAMATGPTTEPKPQPAPGTPTDGPAVVQPDKTVELRTQDAFEPSETAPASDEAVGLLIPGVVQIGAPEDPTELGPPTGTWTGHAPAAREALRDLPSATARLLAIKDFAAHGIATRKGIRRSFGAPDEKRRGYWYYGDDLRTCEECRGALQVNFLPDEPGAVLGVSIRGEPGLQRLLEHEGSSWPPLGILRATPGEVQSLLGTPDKIVQGVMWSYAGTGLSVTFGRGTSGPVVEHIHIDPR